MKLRKHSAGAGRSHGSNRGSVVEPYVKPHAPNRGTARARFVILLDEALEGLDDHPDLVDLDRLDRLDVILDVCRVERRRLARLGAFSVPTKRGAR